jgi:peroxiredoxin
MKRVLASISALICLCGCIKEKNNGHEITIGDRIPDFEVVMTDGIKISDESLAGNVSCIMFFHTSCPDCRQTLPVIQDIYDIYTKKGVKFVLISREQGQKEIETFWTENRLTMPFSPQTSRKVYNIFAQTRIPRIYISEKSGIVMKIFTDNPLPSFSDIETALNSVIEKSLDYH